MKLYIVQMYRWGDEDGHSYIEGVYSNRRLANKHGKSEQIARAGKYEYKIWVHPLNKPRALKYMSSKTVQKRMAMATKKVRQKHPEWFDKNGSLKP